MTRCRLAGNVQNGCKGYGWLCKMPGKDCQSACSKCHLPLHHLCITSLAYEYMSDDYKNNPILPNDFRDNAFLCFECGTGKPLPPPPTSQDQTEGQPSRQIPKKRKTPEGAGGSGYNNEEKAQFEADVAKRQALASENQKKKDAEKEAREKARQDEAEKKEAERGNNVRFLCSS